MNKTIERGCKWGSRTGGCGDIKRYTVEKPCDCTKNNKHRRKFYHKNIGTTGEGYDIKDLNDIERLSSGEFENLKTYLFSDLTENVRVFSPILTEGECRELPAKLAGRNVVKKTFIFLKNTLWQVYGNFAYTCTRQVHPPWNVYPPRVKILSLLDNSVLEERLFSEFQSLVSQ